MDSVEQHAALLKVLKEARDVGILGPMPIEAQVEHARGFAFAGTAGIPEYADEDHGAPRGVVGPPQKVLDLGSGGGLPGLVVALEFPGSKVSLLESGGRRADFLRRAVDECGLEDRVNVIHCRAEEAGRYIGERDTYDLVVARSFGVPSVVAECAAPFLRVGGLLVVSEPPDELATPERWPEAGLGMLGMSRSWTVRQKFGYRVIIQGNPCPDRFPRRVGIPGKRHLF